MFFVYDNFTIVNIIWKTGKRIDKKNNQIVKIIYLN